MTSDHSAYRYSDELPGDEEMIPHLHVRPEDRENRGKGKKDREKREREEAALPKLSCTLSYKDFPPYDYLYRDRISSQTHGVPIGVSLLDHEQAPEDATEEVVLTYLRVVFMTWDRSGNVRLQIAPFNYEGKDVSTLRTKEPYPSPRVAKPTGYSTFLVEELRGLNGRNLERAVFNRPEHARWNPLLQYYPSFDAMKTASYRKDSILAAQNRLTNGSYHIPGFHGEEDEEVIEAMDCVARIEKIMTDGLDLIKDSVVRHPSFNPTHAQEVVLAGSRVQDQLLRELSRIQCEHRFDLRDLRREKPSERLPMDTQPELMPDPTVCVSPTLRKSYVQCVKEGVSYPTKKLLAGKPLEQSLIQRLIAARDQPPESEAKNKPGYLGLNRQQRNRALECFLRGGDDTLTVMDTIRSMDWGKGLLRELERLLGRPAKSLIAQEVLEKAANTLMETQDPHEIHKCRDRIHSALRPTEEEVVELFLDTSIEEAAPKIAPMLWRCCSVKEALALIERGIGLDENSLQDRTEIASMMESFRGEGTGGDVSSFIRDLQGAVWTEQAKKMTNKQGR